MSKGANKKTVARREQDLQRMAAALTASREVLRRFTPGQIAYQSKGSGGPVTEADRAVNEVLLQHLPVAGEGWLSEETVDDSARLGKARVWIVDPLDGTREFIEGVPEWCVSIGLVEEGQAVAGGICNPVKGETILGSRETGVTWNGAAVSPRNTPRLEDMVVLASRSETQRGEWKHMMEAPFQVKPMGSVAYKLGLVAAGRADATWTLVPKHEWDIAGGVALVLAAGGSAEKLTGEPLVFNRETPWLEGLLAFSAASRALLHPHVVPA